MPRPPVVLYRWRMPNVKRRGGVLRWMMTEADAADWARQNGVELAKVDGSREERPDYYGERGYGGSVTPAPGKETE